MLDWLGYQIGDPCEIAELDKDVREAVRAQQFRAIAWMTPVVMTGKFICALAMAIVLVQTDSLSIATGLWVAVAMSLSIQGFLYWLSHRGRGFPSRVSRHRRDQFVLRTFGLALVWTVPGALFLPGSEGPVQSFMLALCAGMIAGGAISLYAVPLAAIVYCSVVALGGLIGVAQTGPVTMLGYVMVTAGFMFVVVKSILRHAEVFVSEFVGRMELDQKNALIERLLRTTEIEAQEERRQSEARLVHAQKMEAIGQLTGGIAHDFNNLLAAIQGNAELLELEGRADKTLVEPILKSTQRGSDLVARLLSFARRQVLRPRTVAVGALIENTIPLIRRTLGAEIRIETKIDDVVWPVHVDGAQLEASLINLSLNAFDALSGHGRLVISCSNTKARNCTALAEIGVIRGDFVRIEVSDDGKGMAPHTMERAVDPFFTTKGVGQGSGLGLSMVYGFVRQSGG
ncbi:MAG: ATP-binding protein, partial [Pseudomonadota bacterium]